MPEKALFTINILGLELKINSSIIVQWVIILLLALVSFLLTRNLKKRPDRKQSALEVVYTAIANLVHENMGEGYKNFVPYIGTLALFILLMNVSPLIGVKAPTEELSVTAGIALITFFMVQANAIGKIGVGKYVHGYFNPLAFIMPLNVLERIMLPISLSLRLFGNMSAGAIIMGIVYDKLTAIAWPAGLVIPVPFHFYFDFFDAVLQMIIFVMLTMVQIKIIAEH
ncbi:MAG: F0F1 ATP synthase subunit A [Bacillota bacterium]|nr:F0F1 ATP synthase subunit A [Bacillota bacterium]